MENNFSLLNYVKIKFIYIYIKKKGLFTKTFIKKYQHLFLINGKNVN